MTEDPYRKERIFEILDALRSAGLNTQDIQILPKEGNLTVKPIQQLPGWLWEKFHVVLLKAGMTWIPAGAAGFWKGK